MTNTLLVTCGATVQFPKLIETIINKQIIKKLEDLNFKRVILQYGKGYTSSFRELAHHVKMNEIYECSIKELSTNECYIFKFKDLEFIGLEFYDDLEKLIESYASLVISHAGIGSILDTLKLGKPLIVCINDNLMDNHQEQIAKKFEANKYLFFIYPEVKELSTALINFETKRQNLRPLKCNFNEAFSELLISLAHR